MGYYLTAEVCPNGHHTTSFAETSSESRSPFCPKCGEETLTQCRHCNANIRGDYKAPGVIVFGSRWKPKNHCYSCGKPYPWTEMRIQAAQDLANEIDELTNEEREMLRDLLPDLGADTPRTELATFRYSKVSKGLQSATKVILDKTVGALATVAVKKALGLD